MGENHDGREQRGQCPRRGGQAGEIGAGAIIHASGAARIARVVARVESREVDRHARRRHSVQFGLDGRVPRRHENTDARAPPVHVRAGRQAARASVFAAMMKSFRWSPGIL